jgi:hypothetical protein
MTVLEQTKIFQLSDEELKAIDDSRRVLCDMVWNLDDDEEIYMDNTNYDAEFITQVYNFLCSLRGRNTLTVERG